LFLVGAPGLGLQFRVMKTFWKAQLLVLVCLASAVLWSQAGSKSNSESGSANSSVSLNRVRVSGNVEEGMLTHKVVLPYPEYAKANRIQGQVVLHVVIDKKGKVIEVKPISGHPKLIPTAVDAVQQWRYRPYFLNGEAVEVETTVTVNFNLANV
jgi:TonB family protein